MKRLSFTIPGTPVAKGRPRATARAYIDGEGKPQAIPSLYTPAETVAAEQAVLSAFKRAFPGHRPWTGAVMLKFVAVFAVPKSWSKRLHEASRRGSLLHTSKPDKDNIEKMIVDAINGHAFVDDAQVQGGGMKRYGFPPRIEVTLELIDQPDMPATPGQQRAEARLAAPPPATTEKPPRPSPTKSDKKQGGKYPPALRAAIDAALERDGR